MASAPEEYGLTWPGKENAAHQCQRDGQALRYVLSDVQGLLDTKTAKEKNLFIEGDNLPAMHALLNAGLGGTVKLIYIDPPYNTGNEFAYSDTFALSRTSYALRSAVPVPPATNEPASGSSSLHRWEEGRRHSAWLSMMYPRLVLARELLATQGVIFISIDAGELAQLQILCSEIFGGHNQLAQFAWVSNLKGRQIGDSPVARTHEYILAYAKDSSAVEKFRGSIREWKSLMPQVYPGREYPTKKDSLGPYVTKNELYNTNSKFNEYTAPSMVFNIHYHPKSGQIRFTDVDDLTRFEGFVCAPPHPNAQPGLRFHAWRWSRKRILEHAQDLEFQVDGEQLRIWTKIRDIDTVVLKDLIIGPATVSGRADLRKLGLDRYFQTPKPVSLLRLLFSVASGPNDTVLDFFAGSASTAQAVLEQNCADGAQRRFIMIQQAEPLQRTPAGQDCPFATISQLGQERIRLATAQVGRDYGDALEEQKQYWKTASEPFVFSTVASR